MSGRRLARGQVMEPVGVSLAAAVAAGLVTFLSACVLPIIPVFAAGVAGLTVLRPAGEGAGGGWGLRLSLLIMGGFAAVFVVLGATGTVAGAWTRWALPLLQVLGGVLLVGVGAALVIERRRTRTGSGVGRLPLAGGSVGLGAGLAAAWTPCIGPVLASALLLAAFEETQWRGVLLLLGFAIGLGLPFVALGAGVAAWVGRRAPAGAGALLTWGLAALLALLGGLLLSGRLATITRLLAAYAPFVDVGL
jgi:cytochrome c-type biogenesis protein